MTIELRMTTLADLDWVVELAGRRRERIAGFAPRLWNPAPDARPAHSRYLGDSIESPEVVSLRTDRGFVFGVPDHGHLVIDDLAVEDDSLWPQDGDVLLRAVARHGPLRVVCPVPEAARRAAVGRLGPSVVETWWHRDLDSRPAWIADVRIEDPRLAVDGVDAVLVAAPPVYDPGGSVLLVRTVTTMAALRAVEEAAGSRGAAVAVVVEQPDDQPMAALLARAGYRRTTEFLQGPVAF